MVFVKLRSFKTKEGPTKLIGNFIWQEEPKFMVNLKSTFEVNYIHSIKFVENITTLQKNYKLLIIMPLSNA